MILIEFKDQSAKRFTWRSVAQVSTLEGKSKILLHSGDAIETNADPRIIVHCLKLDAREQNPWEQEINLGRYGIDQQGNVVEDTAGVA